MFKGRPFSIGGDGPKNDTYEIDIYKLELIKKAYLLVAKYNHTLCKDGDVIYSVGGTTDYSNSKYALCDCEKYDVANNKWIKMPNMISKREACAAVVMNNQWLYAIKGYGADKECERIGLP